MLALGSTLAQHARCGWVCVSSPHRLPLPAVIPPILDRTSYGRVEDVSYDDAVAMARRLAREEALLSGISTGAIVHAAAKVAAELGAGKTVVAILCDTGERYLSHALYTEAP